MFSSATLQYRPRGLAASNIKLWPEKVVQDGAVLSKVPGLGRQMAARTFRRCAHHRHNQHRNQSGIRGKTRDVLGAVLGEGTQVLASRDPDNASRMIKRAIACGLMSAGVHVHDMQTTAIPDAAPGAAQR
jgi:mannose-1-phosphate guanylyltransferase / phosphomannomutase